MTINSEVLGENTNKVQLTNQQVKPHTQGQD